MQIVDSFPFYIFLGKKSWFKYKILYRFKKFAVEMSDIIKEMSEHVPESFFWLNILLAADMAKTPLNGRSAVKAVLFFSFWYVGHSKI